LFGSSYFVRIGRASGSDRFEHGGKDGKSRSFGGRHRCSWNLGCRSLLSLFFVVLFIIVIVFGKLKLGFPQPRRCGVP
jgi:hypothetical protein